jgi:hypothetical protein
VWKAPDISGHVTDGTRCPKCGEWDRLKPRWFGVPRNLFVLNGRVRARGADGGSHRVYGWTVERQWFTTMFGRSTRHVDRIVCPNPWHEWPEEQTPNPRPPRIHRTAEERRAKAYAKRQRADKKRTKA